MLSDLFLRSTLSERWRRVLSFLSFHLPKLVIDVVVWYHFHGKFELCVQTIANSPFTIVLKHFCFGNRRSLL